MWLSCRPDLLPCRSVILLDHVLVPLLRLLLGPLLGAARSETLSAAFVGAYNLLWLLPAYAISFLVNCIWCAWAAGLWASLHATP